MSPRRPEDPPRSQGLTIVWLVAAVVLGGLVVWRFVLRESPPPDAPRSAERERTSEAASPAPTPSTSPSPTPSLPTPAPALPALPPTAPKLPDEPAAAGSPAEGFAGETRDPAWAPRLEAEIAQRLKAVPAQLTTECRSSHCKLTLDGDQASVSKTIALLETHRGLVDFAASIYLTTPVTHEDGTVQIETFATFTRSD